MKKFAMAAVAALSLSTASAESCASSFSGFYAGAQLGMNSVTGTTTVDAAAAAYNRKGGNSAKSFLGGLFAGYGMGVGSCAYVGGELYTNFANNSMNILTTNNTKDTFKNTYNMGLKVRLGCWWSCCWHLQEEQIKLCICSFSRYGYVCKQEPFHSW